MYIAARGVVLATIFFTALLGPNPVSYGQVPAPTPTSTPGASTIDKVKKEAGAPADAPVKVEATVNAAPAESAATPETGFWTREEMTGDWGGTRSWWKEKGVELEFKLTQFYQGVAAGGIDTGSEYNGKLQGFVEFDLGKLAGWNFWLAELKTEMRYGGPLPGRTGSISPINTAEILPGVDGTVFSITALNVTRLFPIDLKKGDLIAVSAGRFNMLDLIDEDFFGGSGTERFFNIAQIGPLTVLRQVPLITNLGSVAYIRGGEPFITFALIDPNDHSTDTGLSNLFADGVTFAPAINFPTKYWGKTGKHTIGGAITTKKYTPFDAITQIILPGPPDVPIEPKRGSWSANYTFRQYIVERGRKDGWGFFGQVAIADRGTSPITGFVNLGLGGNGLFKNRQRDEFGIAYAYTDLSKDLKDAVDPITIGRLRVEHQIEAFYNFHITPWLRLTGDLQIIRPSRPIADTAFIPGARLEIIF